LDLRPVKSLRPHEETIDSNTRDMVSQLQSDGVQKDPIIVDGATGVVLDGMHRLSAFSSLGVAFAACSLVDYGAPNVSLGRWLRVYALSGTKAREEFLDEVGLKKESSTSEAIRMLERREAPAAAFASGTAFLPHEVGNIDMGFKILRRSDDFAQSRKLGRSFVGEDELAMHAQSSSELVIAVGRLDKGDVVGAGMSGRLFPCKTSKHFVDPRPVAVNMPIDELMTGSRKTLDKLLTEKRFEALPPNSVYEGRKYKERLLLLSRR
jgi:hypothetical protein